MIESHADNAMRYVLQDSPEVEYEPPFAPDIAVDVRSPSHRAALMAKKIEQYLVHGARLVLDVDPAARIVHAYSSDIVRTYGKGERFECASFPCYGCSRCRFSASSSTSNFFARIKPSTDNTDISLS